MFAGGYVFNTEAHPVDAGALYCCSEEKQIHEQEIENVLSHIDLLRLVGVDQEDEIEMSQEKMLTEPEWDEEGEKRSLE